MALKRFNIEEKGIAKQSTKVTVKTKEDLINAALIILRKSQLDMIETNKDIKSKMNDLNAEFRKKPTFKLLNIVSMWIDGKKKDIDLL